MIKMNINFKNDKKIFLGTSLEKQTRLLVYQGKALNVSTAS